MGPVVASRTRASRALGLAPAAEDEAAQGEAEAEGTDGEAADRDALAPRREPLPAAECLLLLVGQRLAAALLAQRTARPQPEVQVVEDLGRRLVGHFTHCIACFADGYAHPALLGSPFRGARRPGVPRGDRRVRRPGAAGADRRDRRPDAPRTAGAARP